MFRLKVKVSKIFYQIFCAQTACFGKKQQTDVLGFNIGKTVLWGISQNWFNYTFLLLLPTTRTSNNKYTDNKNLLDEVSVEPRQSTSCLPKEMLPLPYFGGSSDLPYSFTLKWLIAFPYFLCTFTSKGPKPYISSNCKTTEVKSHF